MFGFEKEIIIKAQEPKIESWKEKNFDVDKRIETTRGQFIEIAGPTAKGYKQVDLEKLPRKIYITNLFPGCPYYKKTEKGDIVLEGYEGKVDFEADATEMPLRDSSVGAVFSTNLSAFPSEKHNLTKEQIDTETDRLTKILRENAMKEAWRILEPGGLLIWQGGKEEDFTVAHNLGFRIVQYQKEQYEKQVFYSCIFEK